MLLNSWTMSMGIRTMHKMMTTHKISSKLMMRLMETPMMIKTSTMTSTFTIIEWSKITRTHLIRKSPCQNLLMMMAVETFSKDNY